ncbi:hypothetical protein [Azospirillum largimobile]
MPEVYTTKRLLAATCKRMAACSSGAIFFQWWGLPPLQSIGRRPVVRLPP